MRVRDMMKDALQGVKYDFLQQQLADKTILICGISLQSLVALFTGSVSIVHHTVSSSYKQ